MQLEKEKARASKLQADVNAMAAAKPKAALPASVRHRPPLLDAHQASLTRQTWNHVRAPRRRGCAPQAVEGIARQMVEQAAEAAEQANKQVEAWKDKYNQQTNKISQLEQKARCCSPRLLLPLPTNSDGTTASQARRA